MSKNSKPNQAQKKLKKSLKRKKILKTITSNLPQNSKTNQIINTAYKSLSYPIKDCFITAELLVTGVGFALISRQLDNDMIAVSIFQLFLDHNGVQEAGFMQINLDAYKELLLKMRSHFYKIFGKKVKMLNYENGLCEIHPKPPEFLKKLISGSVQHARTIGKQPHKDFDIAFIALESFEQSSCQEEFHYGKYRDIFIEKQKEFEIEEQKILDQAKLQAITELKQYYSFALNG